MKNRLLAAATIPSYSNTSPILFGHSTKIGRGLTPTNTVADIKCSGLVTGHTHHHDAEDSNGQREQDRRQRPLYNGDGMVPPS